MLQIEWNRRKLPSTAPPCVTLRRLALLLERYGYEGFLVGQPYLPLTHGMWRDEYEGRQLACPPYCTGDVVGIRRGLRGREALVKELVGGGGGRQSGSANRRERPRVLFKPRAEASSRYASRAPAADLALPLTPHYAEEPVGRPLRRPKSIGRFRPNMTSTASWLADR